MLELYIKLPSRGGGVLAIMFAVIFTITCASGSNAMPVAYQGGLINLDVTEATFDEIIKEVKKQTNYRFVYQNDHFKNAPKLSLQVSGATVEEALLELRSQYHFGYEISGKTIIIKKVAEPKPKQVEKDDPLKSVSGKVLDAENGEPVVGASVIVKGTGKGTITDTNGMFTVDAEVGQVIAISFIGFRTYEFTVGTQTSMTISLEPDASELQTVVISGSRGKDRTVFDSPVPIDNIDAEALVNSGQTNLDQMINYRVPSYNSSNQTISDATAHFDPSELRNLGPSRTLVLVNGKRKNQSALVYVNDTPGKGEVGVDMKSIPTAAIQRVEVLRDGAAAQYGSDAIAGVVNIILKENTEGSINLGTGITTEGDGFTYEGAINKGFQVGAGTLNLTGSYYHQDYTDRAGEPGEDVLFGVDGSNAWIQDNPDLGMIVGQPEYDKVSLMANFNLPYADEAGEFYTFAGYTYRDGKSFALYRAPYWISDDAGLLTPDGQPYNGFQPTFETDINDLTFTVGNKYRFNEWNTDISLTSGSNSVDYTIGNTINVSLLPDSPTEFDAGAYKFGNLLGNLDVSRSFGATTIYFGTEVRKETFEVEAGQEESYVDGGAQSFPGLQPGNALEADRTNVGLYIGADFDITDDFLIGGALRYEDYSDFGDNLSWKVNSRYLLADDKLALRASVSTGFRAPSLHQIYLSNVQTLVSGGTVSNQGTFNNVSPVIRGLGIPALDAETSFNISAGLTTKITDQFSLSMDAYQINVDNRVLFTGEIGFDGDDATTNAVEQILIDNSVTSIKFFVNALDTKTQGLDLIADYKGIGLGSNSSMDLILSLNLNKTEIEGSIEAPGVVGEEGYEIFNRKEQSRVTTARPNTKALFGINLNLGKFNAILNNTYFGEVTWKHFDNGLNGAPLGPGGSNLPVEDEAYDQTFAGKVITDVILGYAISEKFNVNFTINNLFNVYPDEIDTKGDFVTDLGGRFRYPWEVNQFGFNGTMLRLGVNYQF